MSAHSTNIVQTTTDDEFRWLLRPIYYILRPGNRLVPLIAHDELPSWLKIVGSYYVDVTKIVTVNEGDPYPRKGEYDIICQYCVDATEHMHRNDETRYDANREEQGIEALRERGYAPTGQNRYAQRVPAASEAPAQQLRQPQLVRALQRQFVQPANNHHLAQSQQPVRVSPVSQSSQIPPSLQISLSSQTSQPALSKPPPPLLPHISSLSPLPPMPSLPSQPSGINPEALQQAVQQALQLRSLQQPQQQQLQYQQQQLYLPQQLSQQQQTYLPQQPYQQQQQQLHWWQDRGRTRDRDQLRHHPWDYKSPPGQPRRRLLTANPHPRSRSPIVNLNVKVRQGEESRGLNATAPAFVPSAARAGSGDGSGALINQ